MISLRAHHLNLLYGYIMLNETEDPSLRDYRLSLKDKRIIENSIEAGHSKDHGITTIETMKKILEGEVKVKITDTLDDICVTCNDKKKKSCVEFIPYDFSAVAEDRVLLHHYGLQRKVYTSNFIVNRLKEKGPFY